MPIGNFYGNRLAGFDDNLQPLFYDNEGNIVKYYRLSNNTLLGNGSPICFVSFFSSSAYKNIEFSFLVKGAFSYQIVDESNRFFSNNLRIDYDKIYDAIAPYRTDYYVKDGDYLILDYMALSYNFTVKNKRIKMIK